MDGWTWAALVIATASTIGITWWGRRARRVYMIDHMKVEMHPACVVDDRVVEQVWRAAISMTNTSRRPRLLPVVAERATVRAGRSVFLANVYLDADVHEGNPQSVALAWVYFALPNSTPAGRIDIDLLTGERLLRTLRWAPRSGPASSAEAVAPLPHRADAG